MDIKKLDRKALKSFFVKNAIPTEGNFKDLIDGMINQKDDGIVKLPDEPLSLQADGSANSQKKVINFYGSFADPKPAWTLSLNAYVDPNNPATTARPGWNIGDADGNSRLFIDQNTGNVGIGTSEPRSALGILAVTKRQISTNEWADMSASPGGFGLFAGNAYLNHDKEHHFRYASQHDNIGAIGLAVNYPNWNNLSIISSGTTSSRESEDFTPKVLALFTHDGRVGIGTADPAGKLNIHLGNPQGWDGNIPAIRLTSPDARYYLDVNSYIVAGGNVGYQFSPVAGGTANAGLIIDTFGNVGIGTTIPGNLLEIKNSGGTTPGVVIGNGTGRYQLGVGIVTANDGKFGIYDFKGSSNRFVIDTNGNVGIGTTNPAGKLNIHLGNPQGWDGNIPAIRLTSPDARYYLDVNSYIVAGGNVGYQFSPVAGGTANAGLIIDTFGNVGIGTTIPGNLLEIKNSGGTTPGVVIGNGTGRYQLGVGIVTANDGKFGIYDFKGSSNRFVIDTNGNVGIGTASPDSSNKLQVEGNLHVNGNSIFLREGASDQFDVIRWNRNTDRVDIGGYNGVSLCFTGKGTSPSLTPVLSVDGDGNTCLAGKDHGQPPLVESYAHSLLLTGIGGKAIPFMIITDYREHFIGNSARSVTIASDFQFIAQGITAQTKNFKIPHPLDPERRTLVHSCLEGPEIAVFYRGKGRLDAGEATIRLPEYFEALTAPGSASIMLTPIFHPGQKPCSLAASEVADGAFTVVGITDSNSAQAFFWEVKATRKDVAPLEVEPCRAD